MAISLRLRYDGRQNHWIQEMNGTKNWISEQSSKWVLESGISYNNKSSIPENVNEPGVYIVKWQAGAKGAVGGVIRSNGYYILMTWVSDIVCFKEERRRMVREEQWRETPLVGKKIRGV